MLEEMATIGEESIVSWLPHGKAFRVHQPEVFARTVMQRYFSKQTKYKSFQRQLHVYNFSRITNGEDEGAYFHSKFNRNKKSTILRMSCKKRGYKKSSHKVHHHADGDQFFYSSETTNVANDQYQDKRSLTIALQSDPTLHTCTTNNENNAAFLFSKEVPDPSPSQQLIIGSEIGLLVDWMEQAHSTIFSRDEEGQACVSRRFYHGHDSSVSSGKGRDGPTLSCWRDQQKHGDEGFFEGKKFFDVAGGNENAALGGRFQRGCQ